MLNEVESARIQVFGADPRHAELEARELREVLHRLDGAQVRFVAPEAPRNTEGAKGPELLTPEVVLVLTTGSFALAGTAIKAWVEVRKSRKVRVVHSDGTVTEFQGGVSGREVKALRDGQGDGTGTGPGGER
ncbi:effector-associated constant component EACC1 [Streptomyces inhibens]|uniref:effector-associated constant component EACC1 n=1 Tax=Streptomyces inhibens TaxID=2293571 RepID=UPI00402AE17D